MAGKASGINATFMAARWWSLGLTLVWLVRLELIEHVLECHQKEDDPAGQDQDRQGDAVTSENTVAQEAGNQQSQRREDRRPHRDLAGSRCICAVRRLEEGPDDLDRPEHQDQDRQVLSQSDLPHRHIDIGDFSRARSACGNDTAGTRQHHQTSRIPAPITIHAWFAHVQLPN
jgi:hypothetical protein